MKRNLSIEDCQTTSLGRKDHGMQAPARVDNQIFHPARRVGQQRPDELRRGAPRSHLIEAAAAIAPGPHRAVRRHRYGQKPRGPGPRHALRDALADMIQPIAVCKDKPLTVRAQRLHRQGVQHRTRGRYERLLT